MEEKEVEPALQKSVYSAEDEMLVQEHVASDSGKQEPVKEMVENVVCVVAVASLQFVDASIGQKGTEIGQQRKLQLQHLQLQKQKMEILSPLPRATSPT